MLYCASSNPRLPFIHVLVYRSLTVAAPNRGREKNAVRRRKRLRHHRQVVCLQRWGRRFRLPTSCYVNRAKRRLEPGAPTPSSSVETTPNPAAIPSTSPLKHAAGAGLPRTSAVIAAPPSTVPIAIHWYRRRP